MKHSFKKRLLYYLLYPNLLYLFWILTTWLLGFDDLMRFKFPLILSLIMSILMLVCEYRNLRLVEKLNSFVFFILCISTFWSCQFFLYELIHESLPAKHVNLMDKNHDLPNNKWLLTDEVLLDSSIVYFANEHGNIPSGKKGTKCAFFLKPLLNRNDIWLVFEYSIYCRHLSNDQIQQFYDNSRNQFIHTNVINNKYYLERCNSWQITDQISEIKKCYYEKYGIHIENITFLDAIDKSERQKDYKFWLLSSFVLCISLPLSLIRILYKFSR